MNTEITCEQCHDLLPGYVAGTLAHDDITLVERHLAQCMSCRGELAQWRRLADLAREIEAVTASTTWAAIEAHLAPDRVAQPRWHRTFRLPVPSESPFASGDRLMEFDNRQSDTDFATLRNVPTRIDRSPRRRNTFVASVAAILLIALGATVFALRPHRGPVTPGIGGHITPSPTPHLSLGETLYTSPPQASFDSLSWSHDSKRIIATANALNGVQIWDATTGAHNITVLLPDEASNGALSAAWSPVSDTVAIPATRHLLLVDGLTGKILSSHTVNVPDGYYGYNAVAWSPDGHLIAVTLMTNTTSEVQVWDSQIKGVTLTLKLNPDETIGSIAWSSDGRYLAATTSNGGIQGNLQGRVLVWKVATQQLVFQHSTSLQSKDPIVWQADTHHFAFVRFITSGGDRTLVVEIWDLTTGKLIKQYADAGDASVLAWSPDGNVLAYVGPLGTTGGKIIVLRDTTTDRQVFAYTGHALIISAIAWSPNGKYIASAGGLSPETESMGTVGPGLGPGDPEEEAKVWVATA